MGKLRQYAPYIVWYLTNMTGAVYLKVVMHSWVPTGIIFIIYITGAALMHISWLRGMSDATTNYNNQMERVIAQHREQMEIMFPDLASK